MSRPIVAIVGRPNVGKSTLFNKLIGQRLSIVEDTPGVTRDRIFGECEWKNRKFSLVDTGGIEPESKDIILSQMRTQAQIAIDSADCIIFVTDVRTGMVATDLNIAQMLQRSNVPVIVCVNKCDTLGDPPADFYEFYNLGLGDPIQVSSVHGHGTGDLLDAVLEHLPEEKEEEDEGEIIKVAVIGKPNVGKSSLVNRVSGENRCIVSNIAGTTRDAVDTTIENKYGVFTFIDTAGLRRKSKVEDSIEHYSNLRAEMAVDRADVCVILIDATVGFTEQDSKVAGIAHEAGKGCIIAVNKWDAVEKDDKTMQEYKTKLEKDFSFMSYAPIIFISAQTGQRLDRLFELIHKVASSNAMRITTGTLNDILAQATARVQPPTDKGKRLKIYYMTQASTRPPTFICFVNSKELFHFSYQRYLENRIREIFSLEGTPVRMIVRERGDLHGKFRFFNFAAAAFSACGVSAWQYQLCHFADQSVCARRCARARQRQRGCNERAARGGQKSLCADVSARFLQVCCERFGRLFSCKARVRCKRRRPRNGAPWHVCGGLLLHDRPHVPAVLRLPRRQGRCDHGGDDAFARLARVPHLLCGVPSGVPEKAHGLAFVYYGSGDLSRCDVLYDVFCGLLRGRAAGALRCNGNTCGGTDRRYRYHQAPREY